MTTAYVEDGELQVSEDKGAITVRIKYENDAPYLRAGALDTIKLNNQSGDSIILESSEAKIYGRHTILKYTMDAPEVGVYSLDTKGHEDIFHDYGEKDIVITNENKYGYIGIYAWAPSSGYYEIVSKNSPSGKCIDATGYGDKANIHQWLYYGFDNQLWKFEHVGNGYYKITNKYSGKVLDVLSYSKDDGANVIQWHWNNTTNQRWRLHLVEDGYFKIISENSGKVLDVKGSSKDDGANIQQYRWTGGDNQRWQLKPESRDTKQLWKFIPKSKSDFRLDVRGGLGQGSVIQAFKKNETLAQKWQLVRKKGTYYRLTPQCDTTTAASVRGNSKSTGAIIQTWGWKKSDNNFLWKFEPVGSGYYRIVNKNSEMSMQWISDAVRQIKYSDVDKKAKDTVKWKIIKTSVK